MLRQVDPSIYSVHSVRASVRYTTVATVAQHKNRDPFFVFDCIISHLFPFVKGVAGFFGGFERAVREPPLQGNTGFIVGAIHEELRSDIARKTNRLRVVEGADPLPRSP